MRASSMDKKPGPGATSSTWPPAGTVSFTRLTQRLEFGVAPRVLGIPAGDEAFHGDALIGFGDFRIVGMDVMSVLLCILVYFRCP